MNKKGLSLALLIILIHLHLCRSTSSSSSSSSSSPWKVNGIYKGCEGENCLIGNELDLEFSLSSHAARMLYDVSQSQTGRTSNSNGASVRCPLSQGYRSCLPSRNGGGRIQQCGDYTRGC